MQLRDIIIGVLACLLILLGIYHLMNMETEDYQLIVQNQAKEIEELTEQVAQMGEFKTTITTLEETLRTKDQNITELNQQIRQLEKTKQELSLQQKEKQALEEQLKALQKEIDRREQIQKALSEPLQEEIKSGEIEIKQIAENTIIRLEDSILFDSGKADLTEAGVKILNKVGRTLSTIEDQHIEVQGHTDSRPISLRRQGVYPTNWELSVDRSAKVVRYLVEKIGVNPFYISAAGFGPYRPLVENSTPANMQKNRRVDFILRPLENQ